jgi:mono/diheme cytochrome c family protein
MSPLTLHERDMHSFFRLLTAIVLSSGVPGTTIAQHSQSPAAGARDAGTIFATTCGWCHSKGGREAGKGPRLMDTTSNDAEILYRIRHGKQGYMPSFQGSFSEEELNALVRYIRALKPE